jgi:hypothetical protein
MAIIKISDMMMRVAMGWCRFSGKKTQLYDIHI